MTGTFINIGTVLLGTLLGITVGGRLTESAQQRVLYGLGMVTLVIGVGLALSWSGPHTGRGTPLYVLGGILVGGLVGEWIGIERRLEQLGRWVQRRLSASEHSTIAEGFVDASLLFCVGSLAVVGSIQDGLTGDYQLLATKAMLDGFAALAFGSALGAGVLASALTVLVYQGGLSLAAGAVKAGLSAAMIGEMSATGGVLVLGLGLGLLELKAIRVANFLPALVIAPAVVAAMGAVTS